ncbi:hypothetical protein CBS101457_004931 [Exobasidium rhododendri]|nr:hypothetical protein CBS101457_004931 [Exobasidium rhododendri]
MTFAIAFDNTPFNPTVTRLLPAALALALHAAVQFREPSADHVVVALATVWALLAHTLHSTWRIDYWHANSVVSSIFAIFILTLGTSMSIYRVFGHPLRKIPGPISSKLSMWTWVHTDWVGTRATELQALHQVYGDELRIGPREISCTDPAALQTIYGPTGPSAKAIRGPFYTAGCTVSHVYSLQTEPTIPDHNRRRRDWDPAFSIKSLATYEKNILRNGDLLMEQIARMAAEGAVDVKECLLWFGFDVMGELGFGRSFGTLEAGKTSEVVHLVEVGVRAMNMLGNIPYVAKLARFLPSPIATFDAWLDEAVNWRMKKQGDREYVASDVFAFLLGEEGKQKRKLDKRELKQDCMLLVVAGSDTTSNALALCLYEMAKQPRLIEHLRAELEHIDQKDFNALRDDAPLLSACLNETLRLWPPVPSGLQRTTTQAMTLPSGRVVPPNTILSTHTFTLHRDPRNFTNPEQYLPERWINARSGNEVHNIKAFSPFGVGSTSCIGKNLAYMEMRSVLAAFVTRFEFYMEPCDADRFQQSIRDQFVTACGVMRMHVSAR